MTLTDTRTELAPEAQLVPPPTPEPAGLAAYLGTGDHKKIGRLYIATALVYLVAALALASVLSAEAGELSGFELFDARNYFQALTLGGQGLVYLAVLPLLLGLAIVVVPLQVGSRSIAFPRAAAASWWGYLIGGGLFVASYAINGGPGGGDPEAVDLWLLSFAILAVALLLGALCVVTTVITLRPPGMDLDRVPIFSWSMAVAGALWLLSLPVLLASLALAYVDHRYGRLGIGGNYDIYPWLHWSVRAPQVFLWAVPALGIAGEIIPVMAGARMRYHKTVMALVAFVGILGFGAYTVGAYRALASETATLPVVAGEWTIYDSWWMIATLVLLPLPILALLGGWGLTFLQGRARRINGPLLGAAVAVVLLLAAAGAAAVGILEPFDLHQTQYSAGVAALALGAAAVAALAGLQYWATKIWGRSLPAGVGLVVAALGLAGVLTLGVGQLVAGGWGQRDLVLVASNGSEGAFDGSLEVPRGTNSSELANVAATGGYAALAAAALVLGLGALKAAAGGDDEVPADPWEGFTLEWATTSPPAPANFDEVALVTSPTPLLDLRPDPGGD